MSRGLKISLWIGFIAALLYIPFIGNVHLFDWDEINFAESAREMLLTKDYLNVQIFYEPFWEKPPLFIWFQVVSMKIFGVNEFAARFPNAIAGVVTLIVLFNFGKKIKDEKFGVIWAVSYGSSLLPFIYFKSGIIDPWFNLFIFSGIAQYVFAQQAKNINKKYLHITLSGALIGLGVLTKGPVALGVFGLTAIVLLISQRIKLHLKFGHLLCFAIVFMVTGGSWFILQIVTGNWQTVVDFIVYQIRLFSIQDAGHGGFPFYHFVILLIGVFPISILTIYGHKRQNLYKQPVNYFRLSMLASFWVVLILFSIVQTKIVHYSSYCYFPMSFIAAYVIYAVIKERLSLPRWLVISQIILTAVLASISILVPVFGKNKAWFIDKFDIKDAFTLGNLQAEPGWSAWVSLLGVVLLAGTILAIRKMRKANPDKGFRLIAISTIIYVFGCIVAIVPGAERISQNAAIEFYKAYADKDVYMQTFHKSYAKLFYSRQKEFSEQHPFNKIWRQVKVKEKIVDTKEIYFRNWLGKGEIDKPAYFVVRLYEKQRVLEEFPKIKVLYEKNGYVFCERKPDQINNNQNSNDK